MKKVITTERIPIKMWLDNIEENAMEQARNVANLPFVFKHIVILSDAHSGYGMPIGGVMATQDVVVPNAVGVDISCGMVARKTNLNINDLDKESLKIIMGKIREAIPVGLNGNRKYPVKESLMPSNYTLIDSSNLKIVSREYEKARKALGTLGTGNHFHEIQKDINGNVWIMIHSGSRNLGYTVAKHYNKLAIELNNKYFSLVDEKKELAFLPLNTLEAQDYLLEMEYCMEFALSNRKLMMDLTCEILEDKYLNIKFEPMINVNHNYARMENHFGQNLLVHRKGATSAKLGELGIIPGSQGTKSFIVKGLGNPESFMSCSHGSGRVMGRKESVRKLNLEEEIKKLDDQGIIHGMRNQKDLEEAVSSYKDINEVMANQSDLVEILVELSPVGSIKG